MDTAPIDFGVEPGEHLSRAPPLRHTVTARRQEQVEARIGGLTEVQSVTVIRRHAALPPGSRLVETAVIVRTETPADRPSVHAVNASAFGQVDEADLVDALRARARPIVSLVAEENGVVVGHIMFSPVSLADYPQLLMGLAPMAVTPGRQHTGIGSALVRSGLERCLELGAAAVVVLGHPGLYPRFGFVRAAEFGLVSEYDVPPDAFMAMELRPGALRGKSGTIKCSPAFSGV